MSSFDLIESGGGPHYLELRRSGRMAKVRRLDEELATQRSVKTYIRWQHQSNSATTAGCSLARFDREVRRAARIAQLRRLDGIPRPLPVRDGTLALTYASPGSLDVLLVPIGLVAWMLQSHPVQVLATADALLNHASRIRSWLRRDDDPLAGVTAREALEVLKRFPAEQAHHGIRPDVEVVLPGGERVRGHKVTLYRENQDGSSSLTVVE